MWIARVPAGGAVEVEVLPERLGLPPLLPLCVVVLWGLVGELAAFGARGSPDPVSFCSLRVVGDRSSSCLGCCGSRPLAPLSPHRRLLQHYLLVLLSLAMSVYKKNLHSYYHLVVYEEKV